MEKIYMEDNNYNNQKQSQKGKYHFSIVLSFIVAVMAIASLVVVGFDQISYAADGESHPSEITMYRKHNSNSGNLINIYAKKGSSQFWIPLLYSDADYKTPVFCIEHGQPILIDNNVSGSYNYDSIIDKDYGLLYILNKSGWFNPSSGIVYKKSEFTDENKKYIETYATQVSIWMYLHETRFKATSYTEADKNLHDMTNYESIVMSSDSTLEVCEHNDPSSCTSLDSSGVSNKIDGIVKEAKNYQALGKYVKEVNINTTGEISEVKDTDYYQTSKITISGNPSNDLKSYSISFKGIDGAFFVDADGKKIENTTNLLPSQVLYLRIPKDKVNEAKSVTINVVGNFDNYFTGYKYVRSVKNTETNEDEKSQSIVVVDPKKEVPVEKVIDLVAAPDTGMSKAQTVYFIGLIVLLCGVGIIYASSKPIKEN